MKPKIGYEIQISRENQLKIAEQKIKNGLFKLNNAKTNGI